MAPTHFGGRRVIVPDVFLYESETIEGPRIDLSDSPELGGCRSGDIGAI
jgi:hypothetical protein